MSLLIFFLWSFMWSYSVNAWTMYSYEWTICSDYAVDLRVQIQKDEVNRIKKYKTPIYNILREKFQINTKRWYEDVITLNNKVIALIDSKNYSEKYTDALCAIYLSIHTYQLRGSHWLDINAFAESTEEGKLYWKTLVEHSNIDWTIDLYQLDIFSNGKYRSNLVYPDVRIFNKDLCFSWNWYYRIEDDKFEEYISFSNIQQTIQTKYWDGVTIHRICEDEGLEFITFAHYLDAMWWISVFGNWIELVSTFGNEATHSYGWDLSVFDPKYLTQDNIIIAEWFTWVRVFKNN